MIIKLPASFFQLPTSFSHLPTSFSQLPTSLLPVRIHHPVNAIVIGKAAEVSAPEHIL
jgi:hypothetical protein